MHRPDSGWKTEEFYAELGCSTMVDTHSLINLQNSEEGLTVATPDGTEHDRRTPHRHRIRS